MSSQRAQRHCAHQLYTQHEDCLQAEFTAAEVKQVLKGGGPRGGAPADCSRPPRCTIGCSLFPLQRQHNRVTRLPVHPALIKDDKQRKTATCTDSHKTQRRLTSSSQNLVNLGLVQQLLVPRFTDSCSYAPESRLYQPGWLSCRAPPASCPR